MCAVKKKVCKLNATHFNVPGMKEDLLQLFLELLAALKRTKTYYIKFSLKNTYFSLTQNSCYTFKMFAIYTTCHPVLFDCL